MESFSKKESDLILSQASKGSGEKKDDRDDKPPPPPIHGNGGDPGQAAILFQGLFDDEKGSMQDPASAELSRLALLERLKNEGVTPGQTPGVLGDVWPEISKNPDAVMDGGDQKTWNDKVSPALDLERQVMASKLGGAIVEDKSLPQSAVGDVLNKSSMLDVSLLKDIQDQGASDQVMGEVLKGGQVMVEGRQLAEDWNSMPQADTRRSSHHRPDGKSAYQSGRGFGGTPEYQLDSRRHSGISAPLVHHALSGTVTDKPADGQEPKKFDEKTFVQLEKTPWTENLDPEVYGGDSIKDAKQPKAPTSEKVGHTLDAASYLLGGMKKNVGPHGKSTYTDTTAPILRKPDGKDGKREDDDDDEGGLAT